MRLIPCPACGREVSDQAAACPQCGHPIAPAIIRQTAPTAAPSRNASKIIGAVVGMLVIGGLLAYCAASVVGPQPTITSASAAPSCATDWTLCTDNGDMANHYLQWSDARAACDVAAEQDAAYGSPKLPWLSFSSFYRGNSYSSGIAVLSEHDAQLQNQYGAMVHTELVCRYDLRAEQVLTLTAGAPGLLRTSLSGD